MNVIGLKSASYTQLSFRTKEALLTKNPRANITTARVVARKPSNKSVYQNNPNTLPLQMTLQPPASALRH